MTFFIGAVAVSGVAFSYSKNINQDLVVFLLMLATVVVSGSFL